MTKKWAALHFLRRKASSRSLSARPYTSKFFLCRYSSSAISYTPMLSPISFSLSKETPYPISDSQQQQIISFTQISIKSLRDFWNRLARLTAWNWLLRFDYTIGNTLWPIMIPLAMFPISIRPGTLYFSWIFARGVPRRSGALILLSLACLGVCLTMAPTWW